MNKSLEYCVNHMGKKEFKNRIIIKTKDINMKYLSGFNKTLEISFDKPEDEYEACCMSEVFPFKTKNLNQHLNKLLAQVFDPNDFFGYRSNNNKVYLGDIIVKIQCTNNSEDTLDVDCSAKLYLPYTYVEKE